MRSSAAVFSKSRPVPTWLWSTTGHLGMDGIGSLTFLPLCRIHSQTCLGAEGIHPDQPTIKSIQSGRYPSISDCLSSEAVSSETSARIPEVLDDCTSAFAPEKCSRTCSGERQTVRCKPRKEQAPRGGLSSEASGAFVPPEVWLPFTRSAASFTWTFSCDASSVIPLRYSADLRAPRIRTAQNRSGEMIQNNGVSGKSAASAANSTEAK